MKNKTTRITIVIICLVLGMLAYYAYLSNRRVSQKAANVKNMVQEVLATDLTKKYPGTVREVMKFYNQIMLCLYRGECTDDEILALGSKARELYDEELLEANPEEEYRTRLLAEVKDYRNKKRSITSSSVPSASNVETFKEDGYEFARIQCSYTLVTDGQGRTLNTVYLLRRDKNRRWKIYGWDAAENL
ncbi:MAG: hypothetical protein NC094_03295 [Bacteroidales bacterium]|nr:hypothetical protein [Lachnoclostridium sp.]MCM1383798.1 hypothetical protein [Lachnoclostridium sp.]MCM1464426.1 hypothetical protein [Bacteroidales bacterium]